MLIWSLAWLITGVLGFFAARWTFRAGFEAGCRHMMTKLAPILWKHGIMPEDVKREIERKQETTIN